MPEIVDGSKKVDKYTEVLFDIFVNNDYFETGKYIKTNLRLEESSERKNRLT
jgi:hypothetical protein